MRLDNGLPADWTDARRSPRDEVSDIEVSSCVACLTAVEPRTDCATARSRRQSCVGPLAVYPGDCEASQLQLLDVMMTPGLLRRFALPIAGAAAAVLPALALPAFAQPTAPAVPIVAE